MVQPGKIRLLICIFLLIFLALLGRLFYLQVYKYDFFKQKSLKQTRRDFELPAHRGSITDRNGIVLASTIDSYTVYVSCGEIENIDSTAAQLASVLSMRQTAVYEMIKNKKYFRLIKRRISEQETAKLRELKIKGVELIPDQKRVYLRNNLAANVIGFVDQENQGFGGIELSQERYLQGIPGKLIIESDPFGREIFVGNRLLTESYEGDNITLTIDEFLQYISHKYLAASVKDLRADSGSVIIMDTNNGQILAMATVPDYDPNKYYNYTDEQKRNNTVQTVYEPGSVFKLVTVAAAMDAGLVSANTLFINGNFFEIAKRQIRESHPLKDPDRPRQTRDIIIESLNITAAKLALRIGKAKMYEYLDKFYLRQKTGVMLPGESAGFIKPLEKVEPIDEAVYGFGQGLAVTPLQMISAVNAIANDGVYIKPQIIKRIYDSKGDTIKDYALEIKQQQIIKPQVAREIRLMMQECVQRGTGSLAQISGYSIGGKTGTSQKAAPNGQGYQSGSYVSSFAGIVPGNKPRLTILVVIDNPRNSYYGGYVAAPVFKEIAKEAVRYLAIPEDL